MSLEIFGGTVAEQVAVHAQRLFEKCLTNGSIENVGADQVASWFFGCFALAVNYF